MLPFSFGLKFLDALYAQATNRSGVFKEMRWRDVFLIPYTAPRDHIQNLIHEEKQSIQNLIHEDI